MNIIYIGSKSAFSVDPLVYLIEQGINIVAVGLHKPIINVHDLSALNVVDTTKNTVESVAFKHGISTVNLNPFNADRELELSYYKADLIVVCCFAQLLPLSILKLAKCGGINIHPSLLPKYRGPSPIFWQLKKGEKNLGVSIHKMNAFYDQGHIVNQQPVILEDGLGIDEINQVFAKSASTMLLKTINDFASNAIKEQPQNDSNATEQGLVKESDYQIKSSWHAQQIFNFISAYQGKGRVFECEINNTINKLLSVTAFQNNSVAKTDSNELFVNNDAIYFSCKDGYIHAKIVI